MSSVNNKIAKLLYDIPATMTIYVVDNRKLVEDIKNGWPKRFVISAPDELVKATKNGAASIERFTVVENAVIIVDSNTFLIRY